MTADELRDRRIELGYKTEELASFLGYSASRWSRFENGATIPRVIEVAMEAVPPFEGERESPQASPRSRQIRNPVNP